MHYLEMSIFGFNYKVTLISLLKNKTLIHLLSAVVIKEATRSRGYNTEELNSLLCH